MLVLLILLFITVCSIILLFIDSERFWFCWVTSILSLVMNLFSVLIFKDFNNPEYTTYVKISQEYDYIINNQKILEIPFTMKNGIYNECARFNKLLEENVQYRDNIWIGFYYPNIDLSKMQLFDLTKIK